VDPQDLCHHNLYQTGINTFLRSRISDSWIYWNNILGTIILNKSGIYGALSKTCFQLSSAFYAAYALRITRQQTDLSVEPVLCSLNHQSGRNVEQFPKACQKMAQYVQFVAESLGPTTDYQSQVFLVTAWNNLSVAAKGESFNATKKKHTFVLYRRIKMCSSEVQTPLVKLCFALRGFPDTALY